MSGRLSRPKVISPTSQLALVISCKFGLDITLHRNPMKCISETFKSGRLVYEVIACITTRYAVTRELTPDQLSKQGCSITARGGIRRTIRPAIVHPRSNLVTREDINPLSVAMLPPTILQPDGWEAGGDSLDHMLRTLGYGRLIPIPTGFRTGLDSWHPHAL